MEEAADIKKSCTKLLTFYVEDLLCLAQIDKGTFRKNVSTFELQDAIQEIMTVQQEKADFRQIALRCQLEGMLPTTTVTTDKMRLQQVILSYQSNALKFTPTGGHITIVA